jgi:ubiquinone/menaquinone biosynthesis C-methylase UbiE
LADQEERYYSDLATAFVRGRLGDFSATVEDGRNAGLRLHKFKRDTELPRVQRVLGVLRGLTPTNLLDVGSGRGTFLWPLLAAFPDLPVTAIELSPQRAFDLQAVRRGGVARLRVVRMDAQQMAFRPRSFDVVSMLEVLEHMHDPAAALRNAIDTAHRFVVLSVPSKPDDNPQHLHLFTPTQIEQMATAAGAARITVEHVLNHRIAVIRVEP